MKRYITRRAGTRRDDGDYEYERDHPTVIVDGERQPYWSGLFDHRGEELWVSERRYLGFIDPEGD